jgi:hypothetical protein
MRQSLVSAGIASLLLGAAATEALAQGAIVRDSQRIFSVEPRNWKAIRNQNIVMQQYDYSCGAAVLATVIRYYWGDQATERQFLETILEILNEEELRDRLENGLSMTDLRRAAVKEGYLASIGKRDLADLFDLKVPVIVRIVQGEFEHFVVFRGIEADRVYLADPIRGNVRMSVTKFLDRWNEGSMEDGVILVVAKRGAKPQEYSPLHLQRDPCMPVRPELQAARRGLYLQPLQVPQPVTVPK